MTRLRSALSYANVVSTIALFSVLGGSAYAAATLPRNSVGSAQIRKNVVTSAKVKDRSLTARDFRAGQLPQGARGAPGAPGANGADGAAGAAGKDGARGPSDGVFASAASGAIGSVDTPLATVTLTEGKWILHAETRLRNDDGGGGQNIDCRIVAVGAPAPLDQSILAIGNSGTIDAQKTIALAGTHTAAGPTTATFACQGQASSTQAQNPSLSGIKVATLNGN